MSSDKSAQSQPKKSKAWIPVAFGLFMLFGLASGVPALTLPLAIGILGWSGFALAKKKKSLFSVCFPGVPHQLPLALGSAAYGGLMLYVSVMVFMDQQKLRDRAAADAKADRELKVAQENARVKRHETLNAQAVDAAPTWAAALDAVEGLLKSAKPRDALGMLRQAESDVRPYMELTPVPQGIANLQPRHVGLKQHAESIVSTLDRIDGIEPGLAEVEAQVRGSNWIAADDTLKQVRAAIDGVSVTDEVRTQLPKNFSLDRFRLQADKLEKKIKPKAETARREIAKQAAYIAVCGDKPICGGWDGECAGLESFVRESAHDPDSIDVEACSPPVLTEKLCWVTKCNVRGKNAFGALILKKNTYSFSKLGIKAL